MKLSKALLGAILIGITLETTGCVNEDDPRPESEQETKKENGEENEPYNCPGCGMG